MDPKFEAEYAARELEIFNADLQRVERLPRKDARANAAEWLGDMRNAPDLIGERVGWLLAGHYGKGAYDVAWASVRSSYVKATSNLLRTIATLEWLVPFDAHNVALTKLTATEYATVIARVEETVAEAVKEREEGEDEPSAR